ncbi:2,3-dimethylmalate lyase [bioreactor metagenome]|uniref:2,3-dimethylmalate lyase n=1 Tax=bioreactor metagenome TaxID=1076179 RepID=A0A645BV76_9ZZZZ
MESPETEEEMKKITSIFVVPVLANMVEHGRTPFLPVSKLEEIGYNLAIFPVTSTYVIAKAVQDVMATLKKTGSTESIMDKMVLFEEFNNLIGLPDILEVEKLYSTRK